MQHIQQDNNFQKDVLSALRENTLLGKGNRLNLHFSPVIFALKGLPTMW